MTDRPGGLDCAELLDRLFLFIDNEMDDVDCSRVRQHLEGCPPCSDKYQLDCTVKTLLARSCCEQAPPSLHERVLHSLRGPRDLSPGGLQVPYDPRSSGPDLPWDPR